MPPVLAAVDALFERAVGLHVPVGVGILVAQDHVIDVPGTAAAIISGGVVHELFLRVGSGVIFAERGDRPPALNNVLSFAHNVDADTCKHLDATAS